MNNLKDYILEKFQITKDSKIDTDNMTLDEFMHMYGSKNVTTKYIPLSTTYKYPKEIRVFSRTNKMTNIATHNASVNDVLNSIPKYKGYVYELHRYRTDIHFKISIYESYESARKNQELCHISFEKNIWFIPDRDISNLKIYENIFKFVIRYIIDTYGSYGSIG